MRLLRLEMAGFKSFATPLVLEFGPQLTAVVGPNGSGKSNVADAIRWVLGEQNLRHLRGKRTEDVIFVGSARRAPLGMSEVTIVLDNAGGELRMPQAEVAVTRRAYRSGDNEYFINRGRVRLRDVSDLLARAHLSAGHHAVVGQGLVDQALSLRPEERRGLLEEAAGIRHLQQQRDEALTRLGQTDINLGRVRDLLAELRPRLRSLERQAKRAEQYNERRAELEDALGRWYAWREHRTGEELAAARSRTAAASAERAGAQARADALSTRLGELRAGHRAAQEQLGRAQQQHAALSGQAEALERTLAVERERLRHLDEQVAETERDVTAVTAQQAEGEERLRAAAAARRAAATETAAALARCQAADAAIAAGGGEEQRQRAALRAAERELADLAALARSREQEAQRLRQQAADRQTQRAARERSLGEAGATLDRTRAQMTEVQAALASIKEEETRQLAERRAVHDELAALDQARAKLRRETEDVERERRRLGDRQRLLESWQHDLAGFDEGPRHLARAKPADVPGLLGPLAQSLVPEPTFARAVEAALGPRVQAILVRDAASARRAVAFLSRRETGRAIVVSAAAEPAPAPAGGGPIDWLIRHVTAQPPADRALSRLLAGVAGAADLEAGEALLARHPEVALCVTPAGEVVERNGAYAGGAAGQSAASLLARQRELVDVLDETTRLDEALHDSRARLADMERQQRGIQDRLAEDDRQLQRLAAQRTTRAGQQGQIQKEIDRVEHEIAWGRPLLDQLAAEAARLDRDAAAADDEVAAAARRRAELVATLADLERAVAEEAERGAALREAAAEARTALAVAQREEAALARDHAEAQGQARDLAARLRDRAGKLDSLRGQLADLRRGIGERETALAGLKTRLAETAKTLASARDEMTGLGREEDALQQEQETVRRDLTRLEAAYRDHLVTTQHAQDTGEQVEAERRRELGDLTLPAPQPLDAAAEERLRVKVEQLRSRLAGLGAVDTTVADEFHETSERVEFLSTQLADLEQAGQSLRSLIADLEITMSDLFDKTFVVVAERFQAHFATLFQGGSARLNLVGVDEQSSSGIDIVVLIPGKRQQELAALSGGERALVSCALLFALLDANPPPFCVLDEVDAALDDSNVGRFCALLRQQSARTQFLVITHNHETMLAAEALYGVTMSADSISRIVSLRLGEREAVGVSESVSQ